MGSTRIILQVVRCRPLTNNSMRPRSCSLFPEAALPWHVTTPVSTRGVRVLSARCGMTGMRIPRSNNARTLRTAWSPLQDLTKHGRNGWCPALSRDLTVRAAAAPQDGVIRHMHTSASC
eukprot:6749553-Pyramimonas_sp.AAC.2